MTNPTAEKQFYRVEEVVRSEAECKCPNCIQWTIVYNGPEPTEIGTSWQGDEGKEAAQDVCDLMNMAYDAGHESRDDTVTSLCDRIERISKICHDPTLSQAQKLRQVDEWAVGFMKVPT